MQRVIILCSLQYQQKATKLQLLQLSRISRQQLLTVRSFVCLLKCFSYFKLSLLFVQLFLETVITQLLGILSSLYQAERQCLPQKIIKGRIAYPIALTPLIILVYSQLPYYTVFSRLQRLEPITTAPVNITPIIKLDLLKLQVSLSRILYLALVFSTSQNQSQIIFRSLHKALLQLYF